MRVKTITIAKDYTEFPSGRYKTDGPYSGENFREFFLVPALKEFDHVIVVFDGVAGYGSSFLEEAFGGLVRVHNFSAEELDKKLELKCDNPAFQSYINEVRGYISGQ